MPYWIFKKDTNGTFHIVENPFASEMTAQRWVDDNTSEQDLAEVFYSPHYDGARVTREWKFKRIEKEGLDLGTKRIRHDR